MYLYDLKRLIEERVMRDFELDVNLDIPTIQDLLLNDELEIELNEDDLTIVRNHVLDSYYSHVEGNSRAYLILRHESDHVVARLKYCINNGDKEVFVINGVMNDALSADYDEVVSYISSCTGVDESHLRREFKTLDDLSPIPEFLKNYVTTRKTVPEWFFIRMYNLEVIDSGEYLSNEIAIELDAE